jgi:ubiquinone/menaquinone biosynthesis C-methylase UbiE
MDVWGVDQSNKEIEICKELGHGEIYKTADIYSLPFEDKSFDTVTCSEVLEHLTEPEKAIRELLRVAKLQVIITVPDNEEVNQVDAENGATEHIQTYNKSIFNKLLKNYVVEYDTFRSNLLVCIKKGDRYEIQR